MCRRRIEAISRHVVGPRTGLFQVRLQRGFLRHRRRRRQARLQLQCRFVLGAGRQHLLVAVQLGGKVTAPALRFPTIATRGQFSLVEHKRQSGRRQRRFQALQRVFNGRFQRDHHELRARIMQRLRFQRHGIVFQHDLHVGMGQRLAQALTRRTRAGQQGYGRNRIEVTHGHGQSPASRTRCASGPAPGTACPGSAAHRFRRRAGGACRRCAR